jgi:hypothetical protein
MSHNFHLEKYDFPVPRKLSRNINSNVNVWTHSTFVDPVEDTAIREGIITLTSWITIF